MLIRPLNQKFWDQLKTTLVAMIGDKDGRQVIINPDAGVVVVRAYPKEFEEVSNILILFKII